MDPVQTLHDFTLTLLSDPAALASFGQDPQSALAAAGLGDISAADVHDVLPLVLDYIPVDNAAALGQLPQAGDLTGAVSDGPQGAIDQLQALTASLGLPAVGAPSVPGLPSLPSTGDLANVTGAGEPSPVPGLPGVGELPSVPGLPSLPSAGDVPGLPDVGGLPSVPGLPSAGDVPGLPDVGGLPSVPGLPAVGELPSVPGLPGVPAGSGAPSVPGVPVGSGAPGVPAVPGIPAVPAVPGLPTGDLPSVPGAGEVQDAIGSVSGIAQDPANVFSLGDDLSHGLDSAPVAQAAGTAGIAGAAGQAQDVAGQAQDVAGQVADASPVSTGDVAAAAQPAGEMADHLAEAGGGAAGHVSDLVGTATGHVGSLSGALSAQSLNHVADTATDQVQSLSHSAPDLGAERAGADTAVHHGTDAGVSAVHDTVSSVSDAAHDGLGLDLHAGAETSHGGGELHLSL
ncbi:IniB N-terminal domain-containing protein [Amycolatopsis jiangsuensis]|uniref:IniB N-terminal domain-containing protein n=1 Tax=Amycolatopsis jiangsuensis TaxID=1181879 RepID=UPI00363799BF